MDGTSGTPVALARGAVSNQIDDKHDVQDGYNRYNGYIGYNRYNRYSGDNGDIGDIGDIGDKCHKLRLTSCPGKHGFLKITLDTSHSNVINTGQAS